MCLGEWVEGVGGFCRSAVDCVAACGWQRTRRGATRGAPLVTCTAVGDNQVYQVLCNLTCLV